MADFSQMVSIEDVLNDSEKAKKQSAVWMMRTQGFKWTDIQRELNISFNTAKSYYLAVVRAWYEQNQENLQKVLTDTLLQIDSIIENHKDASEAGDVRASEVILQALKLRSRLLGLDMPYRMKQENEIKGDVIEVKFVDAWRDNNLDAGRLPAATNNLDDVPGDKW